MPSIRQNASADRLPDLANLGVVARVLIAACLFGALLALARAASPAEFMRELSLIAAQGLLPLLANLFLLALVARWLRSVPYALAALLLLALCIAATALVHWLQAALFAGDAGSLVRQVLHAAILVGLLLAYFDLRGRALSPALTEARLQALQARIRPHFLFNSINAVLSLIRSEPKRAEAALEDLAELFRVLMADNRELTPLACEIQLCRQYLDLEQLRLGERLQVEWHVDKMPGDALIPPLVLQPLLENAVYHGIEPRAEPGLVSINVYRRGKQVHAVLRNPYKTDGNHHAGNKMALNNIRERLQLHFDVEARLKTTVEDHAYQVHITLPYRRRVTT